MSTPNPARPTASIDEMLGTLREMASRTLMLHQAVAERFGLGPTDMKALDLARAEPELTAGQLARITGLSSSATTAVLDRLERRGFVERRRDPADRRKVVVVPSGRHDAELASIFAVVEASGREILADYADDQLELVVEVLRRMMDGVEQITRQLNAEAESGG